MARPAPPAPQHHPLLRTLVPLAALHPLRTASHSSLHSLVAFSLEHLSQPAAPPLVLHTLPPPSAAPDPPLDPAVAALPKLVSLHQLVLRTSPTPLHSYTLVDSFERHYLATAPPTTAAADDAEHEQLRQDLVALEWLSGRAGSHRRPRRKHTPLLVIVVSPLPLDLPSSFTHQPPPPLSRSAKRALKRPAPAPHSPPPPLPPPPPPAPAGGRDAADEGAGPRAGDAVPEGEPASKKRRRRRRGKGGGARARARAGAAGKGASEGEGEGEVEAGAMDVDAARVP